MDGGGTMGGAMDGEGRRWEGGGGDDLPTLPIQLLHPTKGRERGAGAAAVGKTWLYYSEESHPMIMGSSSHLSVREDGYRVAAAAAQYSDGGGGASLGRAREVVGTQSAKARSCGEGPERPWPGRRHVVVQQLPSFSSSSPPPPPSLLLFLALAHHHHEQQAQQAAVAILCHRVSSPPPARSIPS